jgi:hypothetical protein
MGGHATLFSVNSKGADNGKTFFKSFKPLHYGTILPGITGKGCRATRMTSANLM